MPRAAVAGGVTVSMSVAGVAFEGDPGSVFEKAPVTQEMTSSPSVTGPIARPLNVPSLVTLIGPTVAAPFRAADVIAMGGVSVIAG